MKESRSEKLSEYLSRADDEILHRAYEIDDAEKMKQYIRKKSKKPFYKTAGFRTVSVAACLLLIVGFWISAPALFFRASSKVPTSETPINPHTGKHTSASSTVANGHFAESGTVAGNPPWNRVEEPLTITSIDMLNYYTAMKVLAEGAVNPYGLTVISDIGYDKPLYGEDSERPSEGTEKNPSEDTQKVYYYELDPDEVFTVTSVIFFQIEIRNEEGFLASKIGTGIADVVITENSLEPMITFKNGDRYYSCCENTLLENGKLYSTHKYIDGFYIVKNLDQENYSFSVIYDNFNLDYRDVYAESVICNSYKNGGSSPDGEMDVVSTTRISADGGAFTVRELERYFNSAKVKEKDGR